MSPNLTLNGNRASPDRIHKIPLNVVCDKVRGLLPKSRGPFATWGQAEEPGVAFEGCAERTQSFRDEHAAIAIP